MVQNVDPIFLQTPKNAVHVITAADTTAPQTVFTAGADGGAVVSLTAVNKDTSAVTLVLALSDGSDTYQLGEVPVAASAGNDGGTTPPTNLLSSTYIGCLDADGSLILGGNIVFTVAAKSTLAADVEIAGIAGDY